MVGMPGVLNAMLVTPNRIMPPSVCTATNGWVVPKPRAVRSARVRLRAIQQSQPRPKR